MYQKYLNNVKKFQYVNNITFFMKKNAIILYYKVSYLIHDIQNVCVEAT